MRCEPPAELRGTDGWHWIQRPLGRPLAVWWWQLQPKYPDGFWPTVGTPKQVAAAGYIYKFPVSPHDPGAVAALVTAAEPFARIWGWFANNAANPADYDILLRGPGNAIAGHLGVIWPQFEALANAAAAFPQPKDTTP